MIIGLSHCYVLYNQLSDLLLTNDRFDPMQSGFRKRYSTQIDEIYIPDDIRQAMGKCHDFSIV